MKEKLFNFIVTQVFSPLDISKPISLLSIIIVLFLKIQRSLHLW